MHTKILVVDDEPNILYVIERCFASAKMKVVTAANARAGLQAFQAERPDVALLDIRLPDKSGLDLFQELRAIDARVPVILMTAYAKSETAIEAMSRGAFDYLLKPLDLDTLKKLVAKAIETSRLQRVTAVIDDGEAVPDEAGQIIGRSDSMQEVYKQIGRVAPHNYPVLITGESGTGKELIARAIYQHSARRDGPFLAINCAALPETLLESELFGHEKGAFTGAEQRRIGKFEQVNGGTIFLDEIGDMSLVTQAKALRLLQQQQFERLGGNSPVTTDVRVIAATNKNLDEAVKLGTFRLDLYYRLNGFNIALPPLRDRRDDIPRRHPATRRVLREATLRRAEPSTLRDQRGSQRGPQPTLVARQHSRTPQRVELLAAACSRQRDRGGRPAGGVPERNRGRSRIDVRLRCFGSTVFGRGSHRHLSTALGRRRGSGLASRLG